MESLWVAVGALGTLALVAVSVWQIREKREAQKRAEREKAPAVSVREAAGFKGATRWRSTLRY
jgi:hypothetical protein